MPTTKDKDREKAIVIDRIKPWSGAETPFVGSWIPVGKAFRWDPEVIRGRRPFPWDKDVAAWERR